MAGGVGHVSAGRSETTLCRAGGPGLGEASLLF